MGGRVDNRFQGTGCSTVETGEFARYQSAYVSVRVAREHASDREEDEAGADGWAGARRGRVGVEWATPRRQVIASSSVRVDSPPNQP